jgi:hypothetical protein
MATIVKPSKQTAMAAATAVAGTAAVAATTAVASTAAVASAATVAATETAEQAAMAPTVAAADGAVAAVAAVTTTAPPSGSLGARAQRHHENNTVHAKYLLRTKKGNQPTFEKNISNARSQLSPCFDLQTRGASELDLWERTHQP